MRRGEQARSEGCGGDGDGGEAAATTKARTGPLGRIRRLDRVARLLARPVAVLTLAAALGLAGCTASPAPEAVTTPDAAPPVASAAPTDGSTSSSAPSADASASASAAAAELPLFTQTVQSVWSGPNQVSGRAYIDALVSAGFDKSAMQVTADATTVGNPAESITFSVRLGDECLVGQVGPSIGNPVTSVLPALSSGGCLIGQTRAINW